MKISYNWLKDYINIDEKPEDLAEVLTDIGLEVEGIETFQSIPGGLEGLIIGEVKLCKKHPNADKLSLTQVDIGEKDLLNIVCGAPNVEVGQKVVVAPVGTTLHSINGETFQIKKTKIRGELSEGMICAEDEIGLGPLHEGIIVLDGKAKTGDKVKDYYKLEDDTIFEIGLTPNRIDAGSHIGVARDIKAYYSQTRKNITLTWPDVSSFKIDNTNNHIPIEIKNPDACPRYCGVTISGVKIEPSPEWLQTRIKSLGMKPISNIVDITNFVLHELGQPLHAFDADKIKGNKVIVKTVKKGTKFISLDEEERELSDEDLMICSTQDAMCIGGVFGGIESGVTETTKNIFLESAYFNPVWIRKTARYHGLATDASFHFERGADPNITIYALKRATMLIKEIAGGTISSEVIDVYPLPMENFKVKIRYSNINRLIGKKIDKETIKRILQSLEINIIKEDNEGLLLEVPPYRVDVQREADVIEEVLRIYGYNNIDFSDQILSTISVTKKPDKDKLLNTYSDFLCANGLSEIMSNSLTKSEYYKDLKEYSQEKLVMLHNPLSSDLNCMRQTLLFNGLEAIIYNTNRQYPDCRFFEFGNCYYYGKDSRDKDPLLKYNEKEKMAIFLSGRANIESWITEDKSYNVFYIKGYVDAIIRGLGFESDNIQKTVSSNELLDRAIIYTIDNKLLVKYGNVATDILKKFDIETEVFFAEFEWSEILKLIKVDVKKFKPIARFPEVKRDLSMLVNNDIRFEAIEKLAYRVEKNYLKKVNIFDVYEGKSIEKGKKSYAISFILQDENSTMKDEKIDGIMNNLAASFEKELGAQIRQ